MPPVVPSFSCVFQDFSLLMRVLVSALQASTSLVAHCLKTRCLYGLLGSPQGLVQLVLLTSLWFISYVWGLVLSAFSFSSSLFRVSFAPVEVSCCAWTDTSVFDALLPRSSAPEVLVAAAELSPFCKHFRWPRSFPGFKTQTPLLLTFQVRFFGVS